MWLWQKIQIYHNPWDCEWSVSHVYIIPCMPQIRNIITQKHFASICFLMPIIYYTILHVCVIRLHHQDNLRYFSYNYAMTNCGLNKNQIGFKVFIKVRRRCNIFTKKSWAKLWLPIAGSLITRNFYCSAHNHPFCHWPKF